MGICDPFRSVALRAPGFPRGCLFVDVRRSIGGTRQDLDPSKPRNFVNLASVIEPHPADSVAVINRGRPTTYGELREQVGAFRGALAGLGMEAGDRVAIVCGNNGYFVTSYLAVLGAGLVAVPLNPTSPPKELQREIAAVGARAAVVGPTARPSFEKIDWSEVPSLEFPLAVEDLVSADAVPVVERDESDLAVLMFTSGT